jgi:hypothetical protein
VTGSPGVKKDMIEESLDRDVTEEEIPF